MSYNPQDDSHEYCVQESPWPACQGDAVLPMVIEDLIERSDIGRKKYNNEYRVYTRHNPLREAYEEALDLVMYLRAALEQHESQR